MPDTQRTDDSAGITSPAAATSGSENPGLDRNDSPGMNRSDFPSNSDGTVADTLTGTKSGAATTASRFGMQLDLGDEGERNSVSSGGEDTSGADDPDPGTAGDDPAAATADGEPSEAADPNDPLHKHPRFREINERMKAAEAKAKATEAQLAQFQQQQAQSARQAAEAELAAELEAFEAQTRAELETEYEYDADAWNADKVAEQIKKQVERESSLRRRELVAEREEQARAALEEQTAFDAVAAEHTAASFAFPVSDDGQSASLLDFAPFLSRAYENASPRVVGSYLGKIATGIYERGKQQGVQEYLQNKSGAGNAPQTIDRKGGARAPAADDTAVTPARKAGSRYGFNLSKLLD